MISKKCQKQVECIYRRKIVIVWKDCNTIGLKLDGRILFFCRKSGSQSVSKLAAYIITVHCIRDFLLQSYGSLKVEVALKERTFALRK